MSEEKVGIAELEEMVELVGPLVTALWDVAKDGVDIMDPVKLLANSELRSAILAAAEGMHKVPAEVKDLSPGEVVKLSKLLLDQGEKILESVLKK